MCSSQLGTSVIPIVLLCNTNNKFAILYSGHGEVLNAHEWDANRSCRE